MRGQGRVYRPKVGGREIQVWWLDYGVRGDRHRESSGSTSKRDALELLRQRIGKRKDGTLSGRPERVTLTDLKEALRKHYTREGNASWKRAEQAFTHLQEFFGSDARAIGITKSHVGDYQDARLGAGAARNSVRYEIGVLSAAFGVAVEQDLLATKPVFKQLAEGEKRSGFFEPGDLAALIVELPADIAALVRFLSLTGWRRGEGVGLMWAQVDWDDAEYPGTHSGPMPGPNACIRLDESETKGGDAREFPFAQASELRGLLLDRWKARDGLLVFHRAGRSIGDFRKLWDRARIAAGVPERLVHDLRRTAARDFRRAGVSEGEIMRLCGWKTRDMFDRYNIIDSADLSRAVAQRFSTERQTNGKQSDGAVSGHLS
ncbi:MAG TPA: tyrosine-type recombinase/integrase [Gemmatimonadaceae bacterium]|nr:tyrosine-type recombinase/integrase [Gemmatimonadaceae bacterium]